MEDSVRFDVWVVAGPQERPALIDQLTEHHRERGRLANLKAVNHAVRSGEPVKVRQALGWRETDVTREALSSMFARVDVFQEGYEPENDARMQYCEAHRVAYAGVLGCPVCDGRNAP